MSDEIEQKSIPAQDIADVGVDIIGDVSLDEEELSILRLPPDFAILGKLSEENFMVETEMAMTKLRWEKRKLLDEESGEEGIVTDKEREIMEEEDAKSRSVFDPINKVIDMRKRRVTDLKENSRIYLPKPLSATEEAKIEIRRDKYETIFQRYFHEKCSEKGNQSSNLTQAQLRGLTKLRKRVENGEIICLIVVTFTIS